ncbi:uncharacterized protein LOC123318058 isoform X2 [Coccinella septempunctata]|uniref:uncharacterized protein LOC123318058 isoform X2 n=1 Tax=Coccinella septempunctata TaxID=41139 RepID=UPI001D07103C|nr:uncharacterized protein LOC123318058 isoform X2 [Coccinella septempunctata]
MNCDGWTLLKLVQLIFVIACLVTKRATDVESYRLFLYLQKISREWRLLRNVTWGSLGSSFADATYGGYLIITSILFISRIIGEIPTHKRVSEYLFLGLGAILYIILGTLELFAIDDLPPDLVDNAIIIGTLSLITAGLFLIDMAGPKSVKPVKPAQLRNLQQQLERQNSRELNPSNNNTQVTFNLGKNDGKTEKVMITEIKEVQRNGGISNGQTAMKSGETRDDVDGVMKRDNGRRKTVESPKSFGIFGKDLEETGGNSDTDEIDDTIPPKMQQHSPVWSKIRKGRDSSNV